MSNRSLNRPSGVTSVSYDSLDREALVRTLKQRDADEAGGIRLTFKGQRPPWHIIRQVKPRQQRIDSKASVGDEKSQARNLLVEGDNLQGMVSLYKYRAQVDLIVTDPPYNTGRDFRYNDKWDEDPNDPDMGNFVPAEDGSKHSKWLRFMTPRLWMMKEMLKPGGVLAICIDHREMYRLGILLDQLFLEENRLGIINWQKSYAPRNDQQHLSTATEYVLVYAKGADRAKTALLPRTEEMDARYGSPDGDPAPWKPGDLTAPGEETHASMVYAIQSPFTGALHYPTPGRHWGSEKRKIRAWLELWGSVYEERELDDKRPKALVIRGAKVPFEDGFSENRALAKAKAAAQRIRDAGPWPKAHWRDGGQGTFGMKKYLSDVRQGIVPTTYWSDSDYTLPFDIGSTAWEHTESGHSQTGVNELSAIVGKNHAFDTVKPLKLFKKIIHIWCAPNGIVMDPFAGSGTTGHAVLELNRESGAERRFVLIERGQPESGDPYAKALTANRLRRVVTGAWKSGNKKALGGGFRFTQLTKMVDADGVLALEREEMIDLLLTSHWDQGDRSSAALQRIPPAARKYLFAVSAKQEGYFLVWNGPEEPSILNRDAFRLVVAEAKEAGLSAPYHVYARICTYSGPNIEFYQIPDRILEKLGFNEASMPYSNEQWASAPDSPRERNG